MAQIALLKADKALVKVFSEYTNFVDLFLPKFAMKLPNYTVINDY